MQADFMSSISEVLQQAQNAGLDHSNSLKLRIESVNTALSQIDPMKDQELFIEYNRTQVPFQVPDDLKFEPCEGFYDQVYLPLPSISTRFFWLVDPRVFRVL